MRRVCGALALAALLPVSARAEPISVNVESASGGFTQTGTTFNGLRTIDLGTIAATGVDSMGLIEVNGLRTRSNYTVTFTLQGSSNIDALRVEILDPIDGDDRLDMPRAGFVPPGLTTSNDRDGFSFAQGSSMARSATFAGGRADVFADELTHRGDILLFSGLNGAENARVEFGIRDFPISGIEIPRNRPFMLHFSFDGLDRLNTPEPASMILLATGLVGMAGAYRRRRRRTSTACAD